MQAQEDEKSSLEARLAEAANAREMSQKKVEELKAMMNQLQAEAAESTRLPRQLDTQAARSMELPSVILEWETPASASEEWEKQGGKETSEGRARLQTGSTETLDPLLSLEADLVQLHNCLYVYPHT